MNAIRTALVPAVLVLAAASPALADRQVSIGEEFAVPATAGQQPRATPAVAFGRTGEGGVYLAVWREGSAALGGGARIRAARVSLEGKVLDPAGIDLAPNSAADAPQTYPRVAFAKGVFLVVWQDFRNGHDLDVLAARVSPGGKVLDGEPIRVAVGGGTQANPDVAGGDDGFLVVYQSHPDNAMQDKCETFAVVVSADGKVGAASEIMPQPCPKVAFDGKSFLVAAGGAAGVFNPTLCRLVGADGKPTGPIERLANSGTFPELSLAAQPGGGWAVINHRVRPDFWGWGGPAAQRAYAVTPDGKLAGDMPKDNGYPKAQTGQPHWLDGKHVDGKSLGVPYGPSSAAGDGKHVLAAWQRFQQSRRGYSVVLNQCDIICGRVDGWKPLDNPPIVLAGSPLDERRPALAGDGAGKLICVYEKLLESGMVTLAAKLVKTE